MEHKIALIGFGGVGQTVIELLIKKEQTLQKLGHTFVVVSICDLYKGAIHDENGLDLYKINELIKSNDSLDSYPTSNNLIRGWSSKETIMNTNADTIIEMTFTDTHTGQPAIDHCLSAFKEQKNVVMTNKGPVALEYKHLLNEAQSNGVKWYFEGAVMSGTPALRLPEKTLVANSISEIRGILNGTCNFILMRMEEGVSLSKAIKEAQQLGYAEADPTNDIEGYDVLYKLLILANVLLDVPLKREDVQVKGLTTISEEDVKIAKQKNAKWKYIGSIKHSSNETRATVQPELLSMTDPLSAVSGAMNAITYDCDISGPITLVGAGAGKLETAYAVLIDLLTLNQEIGGDHNGHSNRI
ncbi:homoserine dehydrogenase [Halalkalibacter sp. APA_J-10(15)]|uniref:homoserine dehydrogenase n=1 Tax=unclassified Halalkalibacter TaxID=2893063 RepID=UPI001FF19F1B|nr:homoserine dehydrogenase [Halalkalibacter sp. APA_J-10(15)]MCK0472045.1 homoserine dehydrogenase [Halalkalibacter sp. APA_J-10(15)]